MDDENNIRGKIIEDAISNGNPFTSNKLILATLTIIVLAFLGLGWFYYQNQATLNQQLDQVMPQAQPVEIKSGGEVKITRNSFLPATIEVKKGSALTWVNIDKKPHQIGSDPYPTNASLPSLVGEPISLNESFTYIFEEVGKFTYHDALNPLKFHGTIIVVEN